MIADVFFTEGEANEALKRSYRMLAPLEGPGGVRSSYRDFDESRLGNVFVVTDRCEDPGSRPCGGMGRWPLLLGSDHALDPRRSRARWAIADEGIKGIDGEPARYQILPEETPAEPGAPSTRSWSQLSPSFRSAKDRLSMAVTGDRELDNEVILYEGCAEFLEPYANGPEIDLLRPVFDPDTSVRVAELEVALTAFVEEHFAQSVTGQVDPEASWADVQEQLRMLGAEEYVALHQEVFDAQQA